MLPLKHKKNRGIAAFFKGKQSRLAATRLTPPVIGRGVNLEAGGPRLKWLLLGMRASRVRVSQIVLSLSE